MELPAPIDANERKLLLAEAADILGATGKPGFPQGAKLKDSPEYKSRYTGERLLRDEPRRFKLIVSLRKHGASLREVARACHCDGRTVQSCERLANLALPALKADITRNFGHIAKMTTDRLLEEIPAMNHAQLAVTAGIATDKFSLLSGDVTQRIELNIRDNSPDIFERMASLHATIVSACDRVANARTIETQALRLPDSPRLDE